MFDTKIDRLNDVTRRARLDRAGSPMSFGDVIDGWRDDESFRCQFIDLLRDAPFEAYFWELPSLTSSTLGRAFECVFVESPTLAGVATDRHAFAEHFTEDADVAGFANLGGDAWLIAPSPGPRGSDYPHLAAFARTAPLSAQHALWRRAGADLASRLTERPLWFSTSGLGIYWLHLRLDTRPKYYTHAPYKE